MDLMKKTITAYSTGDWATLATCFSDTAKSWHNNDTVAMKMSDRIEMFKKLREKIGYVTPDKILSLTDEEMRSCYFTRQKNKFSRNRSTIATFWWRWSQTIKSF